MDLVTAGLERYAAGDLVGAARLWHEARSRDADDTQAAAYLEHLRAVAPAVLAGLEPAPASAPETEAETEGTAAAAPAAAMEPAAAAIALPSSDEVRAPAAAAPPPRASISSPPVADGTVLSGGTVWRTAPPPAAASETPAPKILIGGAPPPAPGPAAATPPRSDPCQPDPWGGDAKLGPVITVQSRAEGLGLITEEREPAEPTKPTVPRAAEPPGDSSITVLEARLKERTELDDFTGSLAVAHEILSIDPTHAQAIDSRERCRERLMAMYLSEIGDVHAVPKVLVPPDQIIWLDLDHRSGFVLSQVDGLSSYQELIEITGMGRLESLEILAKLVRDKAIGHAGGSRA